MASRFNIYGVPARNIPALKKGYLTQAWKAARIATVSVAAALVGAAIYDEVKTSTLQARVFEQIAEGTLFTRISTEPPPARGPQDVRRGYDRTEQMKGRLENQDYAVSGQIPWQDTRFLGMQLYPMDASKAQAGMTLTDSNDHVLHSSLFPLRSYPDFSAVPSIVWKALAFVEDQQATEQDHPPTFNPVINWPRLILATGEQAAKKIGLAADGSGASTLFTQIVKFDHSPGGLTSSPQEKLVQIASAMKWRYSFGGDLPEAQRQSILSYLNGMPLSARKGFGEVIGFADGMRLWFGTDFDEANRVLNTPDENLDDTGLRYKARIARQALSLIMAVKMPTDYLTTQKGREQLRRRVDSYLAPFARQGIFSPTFADAVRQADAGFIPSIASAGLSEEQEPKWLLAQRTKLMEVLGLSSLHDLNKYDISAHSTLDGPVTDAIERYLISLNDPETAKAYGMVGPRLLREDQARDVIYFLSLYETLPDGTNVLRVQADNYNGALNLNEDSKLELGSTAKVRVLASYLETVSTAYDRFSALSLEERQKIRTKLSPDPSKNPVDPLTVWVLDYLDDPLTEKSQDAILEAVMNRPFSASPGERFFTGGGVHAFSNFDRKTGGFMNVWDATERSVNLVFIRMLRDVRDYVTYQIDNVDPAIFDSMDHPQRKAYLERFVDQDGAGFLRKFWQEQKEKTPYELAVLLAEKTYRTPAHLAIVYRAVFPDATLAQMDAFIHAQCKNCRPDTSFAQEYEQYAPGKFNLGDQAYVTGLHPLELGLVLARNFKNSIPTPMDTASFLAAQTRRTPDHLALVFRTVFPEKSYQDMEQFIRGHCGYCSPQANFHEYYDLYAPGWQAAKSSILSADAHLRDVMKEGYGGKLKTIIAGDDFESMRGALEIATHESYRWLEKSLSKQNVRLRTVLEPEAFEYIHDHDWAETGYPFAKLVPSLATAIGVSGDTPQAFAELMQILQRGGMRYPSYSFDGISFGQGTHYAFNAVADKGQGTRVMPAKVADLVLRAMRNVVEGKNGTAKRAFGSAVLSDGRVLTIAGKTGTGDNKRGDRTESRVAAFMAGIGLDRPDRFVVTMIAFVPGQEADAYDFTSGLSAQIVRNAMPFLRPVLDSAYNRLVAFTPESERTP